jgi:CPA1 family monovalent cation:H+ antiporter
MSETSLFLLIALIAVTIPLVALGRRANIPYPIVLVLAGLAVGFIPGLPTVQMVPNLVLLLFLPPLLYWESITAPTDVMWANRFQIGMLAIGLVLFTTVAVAVVAHAIVPVLPWAVAFVFGAIIAPTDELASATILERFKIPRHVIAIVEGESLINDALSLVLYAAALTAAVSGTFSLGWTAGSLILVALTSVILGLIVGRVAVSGWRHFRDTELQAVISVLLPFVSYVPAMRLGASGVLSVVTAGVFVNRYTPVVLTPETRIRLGGFWNTCVLIANIVLFLLVGLQLHYLADRVIGRYSWPTLLLYVVAINAVVIVVRFVFFIVMEYLPFVDASSEHAEPDLGHALIAAWSGLRGAVSLAAALAIPLTIAGGAPFPHRDLIIFLTFSVILVTLVGGGLTLPWAIKRLDVSNEADEEEDEMARAIFAASRAANTSIDAMLQSERIDERHAALLRDRYDHLLRKSSDAKDPKHAASAKRHESVETEIIEAQRAALLDLRSRAEIDNVIMRRILSTLDLAETRIKRDG